MYIGPYRGRIHEICWGFIVTGYWSSGGKKSKPYYHDFWGLCWAGKYTLGVGRIRYGDFPER